VTLLGGHIFILPFIRAFASPHEHGLAEIDLAKIAIKGVPIEQVRRRFKPATREAEVRVPKTDALVGRLVQMAPAVVRHWKGGSLIMTFRSGLKTDRAKTPDRRSRSFTVRVPPRGEHILFRVPYAVLHAEHAQAAINEMTRWIHQKLGAGLATSASTSVPRP